MNKNKYVFVQLVEFIDKDKFNTIEMEMFSHSRAGTSILH